MGRRCQNWKLLSYKDVFHKHEMYGYVPIEHSYFVSKDQHGSGLPVACSDAFLICLAKVAEFYVILLS